jgi:hypothetical protein
MQQEFGHDFSGIRVHTDPQAAKSARAVGALAYTVGQHIVFDNGRFAPATADGRQLLAHELTHAIQQGPLRPGDVARGVAATSDPSELEAQHVAQGFPRSMNSPFRPESSAPLGTVQLQRLPGAGMLPPGDCAWRTYLPLRLSVESAKSIVSMLGACAPGDSCTFLAAKIAAITAEIAARVALDTTCFKGGDAGHRQQVQDKINMMNRCYRFFQNSNCSPELIAAMEVVVARARTLVEAAAVLAAAAVVIAAVAALVVAIIALVKLIAAAAAGAAAAVTAAAAAALVSLLLSIQDSLSSAGGAEGA